MGFFLSMWRFALISHTGACARATRTRNKPCVIFVLARYSSARSCLRCPAEQLITGISWAFGIAANATAEPAGHPHEVGVFECLIRSGQRPPPHTEPTRIMSHAEVCVKNDPIHAVVAAAQQILIESAQPIRHGRQVTDTPSPVSNCPAGATFSQLRLRKSVVR